MKSQRFNAALEMGCLENPECQASHLRRTVAGLAAFGPSASQSTTQQTANNSQVGVQNGVGVGSGTSGTVAAGGSIVVNDSGTHTNSATNINVTTADAANDAAAFSTIDHLITAQTAATQSAGPGAGQVAPSAPVIITTGSNSTPADTGTATGSGTNFATIAGILVAGLGLFAFINSRGKNT